MSGAIYWPLSFSRGDGKKDTEEATETTSVAQDEAQGFITQDSGALSTIEEASKENSENSSRKQSTASIPPQTTVLDGLPEIGAGRKLSSWWYGNTQNTQEVTETEVIQEAGATEVTAEPPADCEEASVSVPKRTSFTEAPEAPKVQEPATSEVPKVQESTEEPNRTEAWIDWSITYRRMSSVVSYVYNQSDTPQATEATPLMMPAKPKTDTGWFSWVWGSRNEESDDESSISEENGARELFISAKHAIENSKDTAHYASMCVPGDLDKHKRQELAVCDTITESLPVKYSFRKRPLTPNEVQERTLGAKPPKSQSSQNISLQTPQNPTQAQSKSSTPSVKSVNISPEAPDEKINQVLPQLDEVFRTITLKTKLRLMASNLLQSPSESHLYRKLDTKILKTKRSVKKIVIIGVHGFLPIKFVRTIIGQSTENSIRFVNEATKAVKRWLQENNESYDASDYDIQTIALESEGKINDGVTKLFKLLENWHQSIEKCDFLFVVSHSQGTPIAISLLAKIIKLYREKATLHPKKIALLSMSGMLMGPVAGLDTRIVLRAYTSMENDIIAEIFELSKPTSQISIQLKESMKILTQNNVKITFSGSINDQFIPISSALGNQFEHPNIFRALYVDKSSQTPNFMVDLIKIISTMKNMGYFNDYKILRELGDKFIGSPGENGGHTKIIRDQNIYTTAIKHGLETTSLIHQRDIKFHSYNDFPYAEPNMYLIPWNLRHLIQDLTAINNIGNLTLIRQLVADYRTWESTHRTWREIKYSLSALEDLEVDELLL